ncbi:HAD hydrolase-like protein [Caldibacillus lycopersici]|uniref:HAD hydrolase-like protein n=1 Tax=Perspicuibacillus lycopersici TaxID=1325689 RepID=A0AAE3IT85_9BACI|nr:HAD hydrolase-like protein [Perspicuibacillus lycopersici]MCU9612314.1 HAD hydrolase-like protein [Perspicuibacillus lycopersici]
MKYTTILFDLDGTLIDTSEGIIKCASFTLKKLNKPELTIDQYQSFIGPPLKQSFISLCGFNEKQANDAVEIYRNRYNDKGLYEAKLYHNMEELLRFLKNNQINIGVATLKRDDLAKKIIHHFGISNYFHSINGIDENDSYSKADIITICLNEIGERQHSKVLLIGDSVYDSIGAEQVGIDFCAVTYGFGFKNRKVANETKNVYIANDVAELKQFLKNV